MQSASRGIGLASRCKAALCVCVWEREWEAYLSCPCCLVGSFCFGPSTISATGIVAAMSGVSWGRERSVALLRGHFTHGPRAVIMEVWGSLRMICRLLLWEIEVQCEGFSSFSVKWKWTMLSDPSTISVTRIVAAMSGVSWGRERCVVLLRGQLTHGPRAVIMKNLRALENNLKVVTVGNRNPVWRALKFKCKVKMDQVEWPRHIFGFGRELSPRFFRNSCFGREFCPTFGSLSCFRSVHVVSEPLVLVNW